MITNHECMTTNHDVVLMDKRRTDSMLYESLCSIFDEVQNQNSQKYGASSPCSSDGKGASVVDKDQAKGTLNFCRCVIAPSINRDFRRQTNDNEICIQCLNNQSQGENVSPQSTVVDLNEYLGGQISDRYYKNRYQFCQYNRTLNHPSLPQPDGDIDDMSDNERIRRRPGGYRFLITADTQFGILMDGFDMAEPDWKTEIEISRLTVKAINNMRGSERPLFVCVCGDLVDTESSFTSALSAWKKAHPEWQRSAIFQQQLKDWKEVWSRLDNDIALVCCCGNHDVGNRPTSKSIQTWTSAFGDDYLAFWANGTYHIALNNCLFYDPSNAQDFYLKELGWLEDRLRYARENEASHIFVHSHFPWFLTHEEETDDEMKGSSMVPEGWGPEGTKFSDFYFHIPLERRRVAMDLFKKYGVAACFSGHFHQNVETKSSWGMEMIVTGPLSMPMQSNVLNKDKTQEIGLRAVDVNNEGMTHRFIPLSEVNELSLELVSPCRENRLKREELSLQLAFAVPRD